MSESDLPTQVALLRQSIETLNETLSKDKANTDKAIAKLEGNMNDRIVKVERSINWAVLLVVGYVIQEVLQATQGIGQ